MAEPAHRPRVTVMLHRQRRGRWLALGVLLLLAAGAAVAWWAWRGPEGGLAARTARCRPLVLEAARRHGVDPALVLAVVRVESGFRPQARGAAGEYGLMQLMPGAVKDWERASGRQVGRPGALFDPALNLEIGTWYLAQGLRRWQNHPERDIVALAQYNAGPSRAADWVGRAGTGKVMDHITISSTHRYIDQVLAHRRHYAENSGK